MKGRYCKRTSLLLLLGALAVVLNGCAGLMIKPFPDPSGPFNLTVVEKTPSDSYGWPYADAPPGAYQVPGRDVYIADLQGDENVTDATMAFGILGMAVATGDLAGRAEKKAAGSENLLCPDLEGMATFCLKAELSHQPPGTPLRFSGTPGENPILVIPYLVFSFVNEQDANLWVVLRVERRGGQAGTPDWFCRYIVGLEKPRPIQGEGGWVSGQGRVLQYAVDRDMKTAFKVMLSDLEGTLRKNPTPNQPMTRCWMFYKTPHEADVQILLKNENWMAVLPTGAESGYFSGVNILPPDLAMPVAVPQPLKPGGR